MKSRQKVFYEDEFFTITKCKEYPCVPGMVCINAKQKPWYSNKEAIKRLAILEQSVREMLLEVGAELTGIYKEEQLDGTFRIFVIPYYVSRLEELGISPDEYQPHIKRYLESFTNEKENNKVLGKMFKVKVGDDND